MLSTSVSDEQDSLNLPNRNFYNTTSSGQYQQQQQQLEHHQHLAKNSLILNTSPSMSDNSMLAFSLLNPTTDTFGKGKEVANYFELNNHSNTSCFDFSILQQQQQLSQPKHELHEMIVFNENANNNSNIPL